MAEPHEAEPRQHRREHQRPAVPLPPGLRIADAAALAEVDLQLITRLAIGDSDRRRTPGPAAAQLLQSVAMELPLRHHDALPLQPLIRLYQHTARNRVRQTGISTC